jgi:hypothetical protein
MPGIDLYDTPEWKQGTRPLGQLTGRLHASLKPQKSRTVPSTHRRTAETRILFFWRVKCTYSTLFDWLEACPVSRRQVDQRYERTCFFFTSGPAQEWRRCSHRVLLTEV